MAGGPNNEAGSAGEPAVVKSCAMDADCAPGICNNKLCAPAECAVTNDCSPTTACTSAGRCAVCTTASVPFKYHPSGGTPTTVYVEGDFNSWAKTDPAYKLTKQGNGDFTGSTLLAPGTYSYKFVVDGNDYQDIWNANSADDGFGALKSVDVVNCHGVVAPKTCNHTFSYTGAATTVQVAGDFTQWDKQPVNMTQGVGQMWSLMFPFVGGGHEYKLIVDGNWILDPANAAQKDTNSYVADVCAAGSGGGGGSGGSSGGGGSGG